MIEAIQTLSHLRQWIPLTIRPIHKVRGRNEIVIKNVFGYVITTKIYNGNELEPQIVKKIVHV